MADRLTAIVALLMGSCRGRIRQAPDGQPIFDVYLPGQCSPESILPPTLQEIFGIIMEGQKLVDNVTEPEAILTKHGLRSALTRLGRPAGRHRYPIIEERERGTE